MQVRYGEGLAIHTDPESCAGIREGVGEALTGARTGGVSSGVSNIVRGADSVAARRRQQVEVRHREDLIHSASSLDPQHVRTSLGNREIFVLPSAVVPRAASGRPEAVADDARDEEVTLVDSTYEAGEQSGAVRSGVGGGRRRDQEECGIAKHGPNAGSGGRVTGASPHT